jgi:hypothetical protein
VLHFETLARRVKLCKPSDFNGIGLHSTRPFKARWVTSRVEQRGLSDPPSPAASTVWMHSPTAPPNVFG